MLNAHTRISLIPGPAGALECAVDDPAGAPRAVAVIAHPNPVQGGTMDNKVVHTLARACVQAGVRSVRFNFRGVGRSQGHWDEGRGEVDDMLAVIDAFAGDSQLSLQLCGFSFGGFVAAQAYNRCLPRPRLEPPILVAPAVGRFAIGTVPQESLILHGEVDDVVPLAQVLDWARPVTLPVVVVPGVGHFFHGQLPVLKQRVLERLAARLA
jgi:alpha/beta superfamily hydrolase